MSEALPYQGPVEALTVEEVAVRLRVGSDFIKEHYTGPYTMLGKLKRISACHLHEWLVKRSDRGEVLPVSEWGDFGNGAQGIQKRAGDQAA